MNKIMTKFDIAEKLYELIENHGSEFGLHLHQNPDDMDVPEIEIRVYSNGKLEKYVLEVK